MESLVVRKPSPLKYSRRVSLLLADDDPLLRLRLASLAREAIGALDVLDAVDGTEAIRIAVQRRPQLALLEVELPHLGGIDVALALRALRPQMHVALQAAEPAAHHDRARECRLPLFDKRVPDRALAWVEAHAQPLREPHDVSQKRSLECAACGYGITSSNPPHRCPMCQGENTWIHSAWRPFTRLRPDVVALLGHPPL